MTIYVYFDELTDQEINQQLKAEKESKVLIKQWWKQDKEKTA